MKTGQFLNAAKKGELNKLKELLDSAPTQKDKNEMIHAMYDAPFKQAIKYGNTEVVKLLLEKTPDQEAKSKMMHAGDDEAFRTAVKYGYTDIVKLLLEHSGDQAVKMISANNDEAIVEATKKGYIDVIKLLLDQADFDIIKELLLNNYKFYKAVTINSAEILKLFLNKAPNLESQKEIFFNSGKYFSYCVSSEGNIDILQLLLKYGNKKDVINLKSNSGLVKDATAMNFIIKDIVFDVFDEIVNRNNFKGIVALKWLEDQFPGILFSGMGSINYFFRMLCDFSLILLRDKKIEAYQHILELLPLNMKNKFTDCLNSNIINLNINFIKDTSHRYTLLTYFEKKDSCEAKCELTKNIPSTVVDKIYEQWEEISSRNYSLASIFDRLKIKTVQPLSSFMQTCKDPYAGFGLSEDVINHIFSYITPKLFEIDANIKNAFISVFREIASTDKTPQIKLEIEDEWLSNQISFCERLIRNLPNKQIGNSLN